MNDRKRVWLILKWVWWMEDIFEERNNLSSCKNNPGKAKDSFPEHQI